MKYLLLSIAFFFIILSTSCSGFTHPSSPGSVKDELSGNLSNCRIQQDYLNRNVFGVWKVRISVSDLDAEIIPARNALAIGDIFDTDLSQFLTVSPCLNCLSIDNLKKDYFEDLNIEFRIKHPFHNAKTRKDLHAFDVRGILILDAPASTTHDNVIITQPDGSQEAAILPYPVLLNSDGYTSHFDDLVTDERYFLDGTDMYGNLNPFLRFYEDTSDVPFDYTDPLGHNVMPVGADYYSRIGIFNADILLIDPLEFYFIADSAYGQSATFATRSDPKYYLPWFNRTEAWRVEYWIENNNLTQYNPASTADVVIQVFDWQQGASVDPDYPDPSNLAGIPESSDVLNLELSVPGFTNDLLIATTPESGSGTPSDPLQYRITVTNTNSAALNQTGLLAVRDELNGYPYPKGRMPIPESPAGFPYSTQDIRDYTLYHEIIVNYPSAIPSKFNNELKIVKTIFDGTQALFFPEFFMDKGHTKFRYYWDVHYDGVNFNVDGQGLPSPIVNIDPGINNVGLGIITNSVPPRQYIYTIPIAGTGIAFQEKLSSVTTPDEFASFNQGNSIVLTQDKQYASYNSVTGPRPAVNIAIGENDGDFAGTSVTSGSTKDCINSSICVIESGIHAGIYVVYELHNGTDFDLYINHGNLDGTGFDIANARAIATAVGTSEMQPCFLNYAGKFLVYYRINNGGTLLDIAGSYSIDYGETWFPMGIITTFSSYNQTYPSAAICSSSNKVFVTWQDHRNDIERGTDIYCASSGDGSIFSPEFLVSTNKVGKSNHEHPEIAISGNQIGIAYLESPIMIISPRVQVVFFNSAGTSFLHYKPQLGLYDQPHGAPSLAASGNGKFYIAYATFNTSTNDLRSRLYELDSTSFFNDIIETLLYSRTIGSNDFTDDVNPAVACIPFVDSNYNTHSGTKVVSIFTDYYNGYATLIDPVSTQVGVMRSVCVIRD
jgi:hypothetical protein